MRETVSGLKGMYALVLFSADEPGVLYALKWGPPIVLGLGKGENFVASDATALLPHTRDLIFLEDGDLARVTAEGVTVTGFDGVPRSRPASHVPWDAVSAEKGGFPHFMAKEIAEQPTVVIETIGHKLSLETGLFNEEEMGVPKALLKEIDRIQIVACGTSWHAGLVAKFLLEEIARVRTHVDYASEFRYRKPLVDARTLVVGISQSGETADTVAALKEAKSLGGRTVGVVNVPGSAIARMVDGVLATHAGPEVGVASTKAFTTQLVALVLFALYVKAVRSGGETPVDAEFLTALSRLPSALRETLALEGAIEKLSARFEKVSHALFLGRGAHYPIALEGALKLKEISYIHAEGYPAGEMKHGPIALIDEAMPIVGIAPHGRALREDRVEPPGGQGAAGDPVRAREPRRRGRLDVRGRGPRDAEGPPGAPARRLRGPAPAPRVPRRPPPRLRRGPAPQPREERDGRIGPLSAAGASSGRS